MKILLISERPVVNPSETDLPDWGPIGALDMLYRGPTRLIGDPSEFKQIYSNIPCVSVSDIRHVGLWSGISVSDGACRTQMDLQ